VPSEEVFRLDKMVTFTLEHNARLQVKFLNFMTPDFGKLLFPRLQPDQRRREMRTLFFALLTGLVIAGITAMVMIMLGKAKLR
jgi:hypothetical protein